MTPSKYDIADWIRGKRLERDLAKMERWAWDLMRFPQMNEREEFTYSNAIVMIGAMAERGMCPHLFWVSETNAWAFQPDLGMETHFKKTIPDAVFSGIKAAMGFIV